jgi:hypothetical protein
VAGSGLGGGEGGSDLAVILRALDAEPIATLMSAKPSMRPTASFVFIFVEPADRFAGSDSGSYGCSLPA